MSRRNIDSAYIYIIIATIAAFFGMYFSLLYPLALVLVPVFISYVFVDKGVWETIFTSLAIVIFSFICFAIVKITNLGVVCVCAMIYIIPGIILGILYTRKSSFKSTLIWLIAFYYLVILLSFAYINYALKLNISNELRVYLTNNFNMFWDLIGIYKPEITNALVTEKYALYNTFYSIIPGLLPFGLTLIFIIISMLQYALGKRISSRVIIRNEYFADGFDTFKLSGVSNIAFIISILVFLADFNNITTMIFMNITAIITMLYTLEAISLLYYKIKQNTPSYSKRIGVTLVIIIGIAASSVFIPITNVILITSLIGFADSIFDFRKISINKDEYYEE